jgi:hypothetical protein
MCSISTEGSTLWLCYYWSLVMLLLVSGYAITGLWLCYYWSLVMLLLISGYAITGFRATLLIGHATRRRETYLSGYITNQKQSLR